MTESESTRQPARRGRFDGNQTDYTAGAISLGT